MRPERSERNSDDSTTCCLFICFIDHPPCPLRRLGHRRPFAPSIMMVATRLAVHGPQAFEEGVAEVADQRATVVVV